MEIPVFKLGTHANSQEQTTTGKVVPINSFLTIRAIFNQKAHLTPKQRRKNFPGTVYWKEPRGAAEQRQTPVRGDRQHVWPAIRHNIQDITCRIHIKCTRESLQRNTPHHKTQAPCLGEAREPETQEFHPKLQLVWCSYSMQLVNLLLENKPIFPQNLGSTNFWRVEKWGAALETHQRKQKLQSAVRLCTFNFKRILSYNSNWGNYNSSLH